METLLSLELRLFMIFFLACFFFSFPSLMLLLFFPPPVYFSFFMSAFNWLLFGCICKDSCLHTVLLFLVPWDADFWVRVKFHLRSHMQCDRDSDHLCHLMKHTHMSGLMKAVMEVEAVCGSSAVPNCSWDFPHLTSVTALSISPRGVEHQSDFLLYILG